MGWGYPGYLIAMAAGRILSPHFAGRDVRDLDHAVFGWTRDAIAQDQTALHVRPFMHPQDPGCVGVCMRNLYKCADAASSLYLLLLRGADWSGVDHEED
jgi:hypothetical protein